MNHFHEVFKPDLKSLIDIYNTSTSDVFRYQIFELVDEVKKSFNAQCRRSTLILAAEILHRLNCELIAHIMVKRGIVQHKKMSGRTVVFKIDEIQEGKYISDELNLNETIEYLFNQTLISEDTRMIMQLLRYLRNEATHGEVPGMLSQDARRDTILTREISSETLDDILSGKIPLPPREYFLLFPYKGKNAKYMIYQTDLDIDLDGIDNYKMRLPAVSFRLLLLCIERVAPSFDSI